MGKQSDGGWLRNGILYTEVERKEMVDLCLSGLSTLQACNEFHYKHPNRPKPSYSSCLRLLKKFQETGSVASRKATGRPQNREFNAVVLKVARKNPHLTNPELAAHFGVSLGSLVGLLSRDGFQRTKLDIYQRTSDRDRTQRVTYCRWFQAKLAESPMFPDDVLFTDEAVFHLHGVVNHHNLMQHSSRKTQVAVDDRYQYNLKVLVWCGIHNQAIVGPYFFNDATFEEDQLYSVDDHHPSSGFNRCCRPSPERIISSRKLY
ncbi:hypothetical protein EG68_09754 [Paragonimus skrjabini miyazakii]|uniref:DUF4817 domain-containing protein n=1 Tax=Paragonimus skrjabini miyazakii TaxID=59628 RepID=A0A8S9YLC4_9TREM|nr:hypothetical protein EG68_09754 [Paragonimus skrjabini miyazakii]